MTNSSITPESVGSPSTNAAAYCWQVPDKPIAVHLRLELIDRLEREVLESFKAVTKRGSEIGGLLLGHTDQPSNRIVTVEQYALVECDYSRGPLYLLADTDKQRLREVMARPPAPELSIVGFFRSNTRKDLALDEDDLALIQEYFSNPAHVFLLVKPFAMKPSAAGFFFWEDGQIHGEASHLQFPFRRSELLKAYPQAILGAGEKVAGPVMLPKREDGPAPARREPEKAAPPATPAPPVKREEPALTVREEKPPAPPPPVRHEEPPKQEARPAPAPPLARRVEPPAPKPEARLAPPPKRDEPPPVKREEPPQREERSTIAPLSFKREERPTVMPISLKREDRAPGPVPVPKRDEPAANREERPTVTLRREERPAVVPVSVRREEPAPPVKREERSAPVAAVMPAPAKLEPPQVATPEPAPAGIEPARHSASIFQAEEAPPVGWFARLGSKRWIWIGALVLVLAVVGWLQFMRSSGDSKTTEDSLGLTIERNTGQFLLKWNKNATLIATAQRATLSINDGDHKEDVDLDLGQLRTGSIVYSPLTSDVSFRLEVTDLKRGKSLSESVRWLAGRPSPSVPMGAASMPPATQPAIPAATQAAKPAADTLPAPESTKPAKPAEANAANSPPAMEAKPVPVVTAQPPKPQSLAARLSAPPQVPEPPSLEDNALASRSVVPTTTLAAPPPEAPKPVPVPAALQPTPPPVAQPKPAVQAPAAPPVKLGSSVQDAQVLRRVSPVYPALARQARVSGTVRVEALIGTDGRVKKAAAISGPPLLRQAAADAVSRWVFKPSMLNNQAVEANTQVEVIFNLSR